MIYIVEPYGGSVRRHNPSLPMIHYDDAAVTRGDGVFETLLISDGRAVNVERHLERFQASATHLDLPAVDGEHWLGAMHDAIADWRRENDDSTEAMCTWTLTRGRASTGNASAWIVVKPIPADYLRLREHGAAVMTSPRGVIIDPAAREEAPWLALTAKTLNYAATMAALRYARSKGFDDVIYVEPGSNREPGSGREHGSARVLEGATSSIIAVRKGRKLRTPASRGDILPGTSQRAIFAYAEKKGWKCKDKEIDVRYLTRSESVWLVSSVRQVVRVTSIDGVKLPVPDDEDEVRALLTKGLLKG